MARLYHHHDPHGVESLLDAVLDLLGHALLHLETVAVDVHHAGNLTQAGDASRGDIGHMSLAVERQHVVLAHREEVDVLDDDHLVVRLFEECVGKHLVRVLAIASCEHLHGLGHTHGCLYQSLALRVFSEESQHLGVVCGERLQSVLVFCLRCHYLFTVMVVLMTQAFLKPIFLIFFSILLASS